MKKKCEPCWDLALPHFSSLRTKIWKRPYNAEMSCFQFVIASRQNVEKSKQCWDQPLPHLSLSRAWELYGETWVKSLFFKENVLISVSLGSWKIYDFQQKINNLFSEQKQIANCNRFAQKELQQTMMMNFYNDKNDNGKSSGSDDNDNSILW